MKDKDRIKARKVVSKNRPPIKFIGISLGIVILLVILYFAFQNTGPSRQELAEFARLDSIRRGDSLEKVRTEISEQLRKDSLANEQIRQNNSLPVQNDSITKTKERFLGEHLFSCFFIGEDVRFGKVTIQDNNGVFVLSGKQEIDGNYVKINGTVKVISLRKFEFTGTITAYNKSERVPDCVWEGSTTFWASGSRVYWRNQHPNCYEWTGDMDIYFKKSGT